MKMESGNKLENPMKRTWQACAPGGLGALEKRAESQVVNYTDDDSERIIAGGNSCL